MTPTMQKLLDELRTYLRRSRLRERSNNVQRALNAIARCSQPAHSVYAWYGSRGVQVHAPWMLCLREFVDYLESLPGSRDPVLWLDRVDNDGHYVPGNLRFTTPHESALNRGAGSVTPLYSSEEWRSIIAMRRVLLKDPEHRREVRRASWSPELRMAQLPTGLLHREDDRELIALVEALPTREGRIIRLHFWCGWTLTQIAVGLQLSRERVHQLEASALQRLRRMMDK